ncbi:DUF7112 family protein [Halalkalicoccus jeotgali]|uniref:Uncharacterized protein n=1 Tax=Halalkalicoccus jeotgali (strain DSM 18796 / CECT 7217 / JCM 14584 / KCTC 4019 / B3) TaxID=795797 RepID=D8J992_HALJB|nr:hypothetical protein [Halalkalicoccus jeotgali]ADJ16361.1 hypothetical protein HacjB3_14910 [Halalkalicoccus jeotgali B3]ELY37095.1 hypothetical protein C497_10138 [Halalkalicoccus jeotgali B3]
MDRISSENPAVETLRATVARHGARRKRVDLREDSLPEGEVVRLVIDGTTYHARVEGGFADGPHLSGAYDTPDMAREGSGTNRLDEWLDAAERPVGSSVLVDVIEPEFAYGLREPGTEVVYEAVEKPKASLANIARELEER